jgi:hypothetical protein
MPTLNPQIRDQILGLVQEGHLTSAEIAAVTNVSLQTVAAVKAHLKRAASEEVTKAKRMKAAKKSRKTARWARIMTKWEIARTRQGRAWEIVNFTGPNGRESRGIVDLMAIRKDHRTSLIARGDFFEIIVIQVKGGGARWPTLEDIRRLRRVQNRYHARKAVLAAWSGGNTPVFYTLAALPIGRGLRQQWKLVKSVGQLFR